LKIKTVAVLRAQQQQRTTTTTQHTSRNVAFSMITKKRKVEQNERGNYRSIV